MAPLPVPRFEVAACVKSSRCSLFSGPAIFLTEGILSPYTMLLIPALVRSQRPKFGSLYASTIARARHPGLASETWEECTGERMNGCPSMTQSHRIMGGKHEIFNVL